MSKSTNEVFQYPSCWDDDTRMSVLFSPFRRRSVNPDNYDRKLEFWQTLIFNYCKLKKGCPTFNKNELKEAFKRKEKFPFCLDTVFEEMSNLSVIQKYDDFRNRISNITWTAWALNGLKTPIKWSLNKFLHVGGVKNDDFINYVHINLLKELSQNLLLLLQQFSGKVFSFDAIKSEVMQLHTAYLSEDSLKICLLCLHAQRSVVLDYTIIDEEIIIKLVKIPGKNMTGDKVTDVDRSMLQLGVTKKTLLEQLQSIDSQMTHNANLARQSIKENNKKQAEIYLRKKLQLKKTYDKKSDILSNIETLILNIEETESNGQVLSALKMGTQTLKNLVSNSGFTIDKVDEMMSTMKEIIEQQDELQDSICNSDLVGLNDSLLEQELNELLLLESPAALNSNEAKEMLQVKDDKLEQQLLDQLSKLNVSSTNIPASISRKSDILN